MFVFGTMPKKWSIFFLNFGGLYINNRLIFDHLFKGDFNDGRKSLDFSKVMKKYRRTKSHERYVCFLPIQTSSKQHFLARIVSLNSFASCLISHKNMLILFHHPLDKALMICRIG